MTYANGEAWELALAALKVGDIEKARALLPHMLPSDRGLMEKRIEAARNGSNANTGKYGFQKTS